MFLGRNFFNLAENKGYSFWSLTFFMAKKIIMGGFLPSADQMIFATSKYRLSKYSAKQTLEDLSEF